MQTESKMGFARQHLDKSDDEILKLAKKKKGTVRNMTRQDIWNARNYDTALTRSAKKAKKNGKAKANGHTSHANGAAALPTAELVQGLDPTNVADLVQLRTDLVEQHRTELEAVDRVLALIKRRT